jgi:hypothetical protein
MKLLYSYTSFNRIISYHSIHGTRPSKSASMLPLSKIDFPLFAISALTETARLRYSALSLTLPRPSEIFESLKSARAKCRCPSDSGRPSDIRTHSLRSSLWCVNGKNKVNCEYYSLWVDLHCQTLIIPLL